MKQLDDAGAEATGHGYFISPRLLRSGRAEPLAHHITMRLADSRVIAPTAAQRRTAARVILESSRRVGLLAFHVVDTHAHALVACSRIDAGEFARCAEISLHARLGLGCPFDPARIRPVLDQWHLQRSILYILHQDARHGVSDDPAHDGSSLPDVLGWRVVDQELAHRVRALAPRIIVPPPADREALLAVEVRPEQLAEAAAAALALASLDGRGAACSAARRAAARVAVAEHMTASSIAAALTITRRRLLQILDEPPPPTDLLRATRIQLRFRAWLSVQRGSALVPRLGP